MSTDMSVAVGGMNLRSPVLAASGTFGYGTEVPLLERRALGAMVSKGIFLRPREGTAPPRIAETPSGMLNAIGLQGPGADALVRDYAPQWAEWDFPVLVNINGESASEYAELTSRLDGVPGVAGFEIRRAAVERRIPCLTSLDTATALLESAVVAADELEVRTIDEWRAGRTDPVRA